MTRHQLIFVAGFGSFALLAGAFLFQAIGYAPCQMCLWQRWPHAVAIAVALLAALAARYMTGAAITVLALAGAAAALATSALGAYHTGVERGWWAGPSSCSGGGGLPDGIDLLSTDIAPIVMCNEVVWSLLGLSMASYNALFSLGLAAIWLTASLRKA